MGSERDEELERLRAENAQLLERVRKLEEALERALKRNAELEWKLGLDSSTSSKPPSSDPPWKPRPSKGKRKRAKELARKKKTAAKDEPSAKKGGGGRQRARVEPTRVHELFPSRCRKCRAPLREERTTGRPRRHQVTEIAGAGHEVDEYRCHRVRCERCGCITRAKLPKEVRGSSFGPRLVATVVALIAAYRLSRRQTQLALKDFWGVSMSLGSIHRCEQRLSRAAARSVARVRKELRNAPRLHMDETGWRHGAKRPWLWTQTNDLLSSFWIRPGRTKKTAVYLLGDFQGVLCSDDYSAYRSVPIERRQMCWSHRLRDFEALSQYRYSKRSAQVGRVMLAIGSHLFRAYDRVRDGTMSRKRFKARARRLRKRFVAVCQWVLSSRQHALRRKFKALLRQAPALWRFVDDPLLEPTNNRAERALRHAVIWRRISHGHRSTAGRLFVERMLTVVQSLRNQGRNVLQWLLAAASPASPTPSLLPSG